jgi:putative ABC transport system permease protein
MPLKNDLRLALRTLGKTPVSTFAVVVSLSLAVGLNTAVFSFVDAVLLRPFPYNDPERLIVVWGANDFEVRRALEGHHLDKWKAATTTVESVAAFQLNSFRFSFGAGDGETLEGAAVAPGVFTVLGSGAVLGRVFSEEELRTDAKVAVISHHLWNSKLGRDATVLGREILINQVPYRILGVMPEDFFFPDYNVSLWLPLSATSPEYRQVHGIARLRPGIAIEQARAELDVVLKNGSAGLADRRAGVFPLHRLIIVEHGRAGWALYGAVILLLLAACANVSSWHLARAVGRARELAICTALGAGVWKRAASVMIEPLLVAAAASGLGIVSAYWILRGIQWLNLTDIARVDRIDLNGRILAYALGLAVTTGLLSSVIPVVAMFRAEPLSGLRGSETGTRSRSLTRVHRWLFGCELMLATLLLIGAGLLIRSFVRLGTVDWGFSPTNVLVAEVIVPRSTTRNAVKHVEFTEGVLARLRANPGISAAATSYGVPIKWDRWQQTVIEVNGVRRSVGIWTVGDGYFRTLGIPMIAGRELAPDNPADRRDAVINERLARDAWPGQEPIGKNFTLLKLKEEARKQLRQTRGSADQLTLLRAPASWEPEGSPFNVIGVVRDVRMFGLADSTGPAVYLDYRDQDNAAHQRQAFILKSTGNDWQLGSVVREQVSGLDPTVRIESLFSMEDLVNQSIGGRSSQALLTLISFMLGVLSIALVAIGMFGLGSLAAAQRMREIAIRRMLGAQQAHVVSALCRTEFRPLMAGIVAGVLAAALTTGAIRAFLFELEPTDVTTYAGVVLSLVIVIALAWLGPIVASLRIDPVDALRIE